MKGNTNNPWIVIIGTVAGYLIKELISSLNASRIIASEIYQLETEKALAKKNS